MISNLPFEYKKSRRVFTGISLVLLMVLAAALPVTANEDPVGSGAALRTGFGARALGMGGAFVAVADDYSAPYWNPAGITRGNSLYLGGMRYDQYGLGLNLDYLSGGLNLSRESSFLPSFRVPVLKGFSFAGTYLGFSTDVRTLGPGGSEIPITYGERAFLATAGLEFPLVGSVGLTGKRYSYTAPDAGVDGEDASASGLGFDLGYLAEPLDGLSIGLVGFDLTGTDIKWKNTPTEPTNIVPARYSIGTAYRAEIDYPMIPEQASGDLLLSGQYSFGSNVLNKIRTGLEYSISIFSIRVGAVKPDENDPYFTAGAGIQINFLTGDLAWIQNNSLEGENTTDTIVFSSEFRF